MPGQVILMLAERHLAVCLDTFEPESVFAGGAFDRKVPSLSASFPASSSPGKNDDWSFSVFTGVIWFG